MYIVVIKIAQRIFLMETMLVTLSKLIATPPGNKTLCGKFQTTHAYHCASAACSSCIFNRHLRNNPSYTENLLNGTHTDLPNN
jgi:hypothetical protein